MAGKADTVASKVQVRLRYTCRNGHNGNSDSYRLTDLTSSIVVKRADAHRENAHAICATKANEVRNT